MTARRKVDPLSGPARARQVRTLFSEIAPRYDLLNHVLSLNIDRRWRRLAVRELDWEAAPRGRYLDVCTGTFDLALELARQPGFEGTVVASDFALPMLTRGRAKIAGAPARPVCADAQRLPFESGGFVGVTAGFGMRNLSDLDAGLQESRRVLRPGGRLVILEFTVPPNPLVRMAYLLYFNHVLPLAGRLVSGHPWAYGYLPRSVRGFPDPEGLADRMRAAGFAKVRWSLLTGGIATLHVAVKASRRVP